MYIIMFRYLVRCRIYIPSFSLCCIFFTWEASRGGGGRQCVRHAGGALRHVVLISRRQPRAGSAAACNSLAADKTGAVKWSDSAGSVETRGKVKLWRNNAEDTRAEVNRRLISWLEVGVSVNPSTAATTSHGLIDCRCFARYLAFLVTSLLCLFGTRFPKIKSTLEGGPPRLVVQLVNQPFQDIF
jgi:hypothetical protein